MEVSGKYASAVIYNDNAEEFTVEQVKTLCDQKFTEGSKIRIMPDCHAGKGCVIGFTADLGELVIPNLVGVDIGCGVMVVNLGNVDIDYKSLDDSIRAHVPHGRDVHSGRVVRFPRMQELECYRSLKDNKRIERSIGTLGGGNHFISIEEAPNGDKHLLIHTGSRGLGKQVAEHYQSMAIDLARGKEDLFKEKDRIIREYKASGRRSEIQEAIKELNRNFTAKHAEVPHELAYLYGEYRDMYLHDMGIAQEYSRLNRRTIANIILNDMFGGCMDDFEWFETMHNYIDLESNVIRKGAVSSKKGERFVIPINMRDGSLICTGKGNDDWNQSAPHGAGRLMSRTKAFNNLSIDEFKSTMSDAGVWSSCVNESTLDEAPMAYKPIDEILDNIDPTADIVEKLTPVYNFKSTN